MIVSELGRLESVNSPDLIISVPTGPLRAALGDLAMLVEIIDWDMTGRAPLNAIDIVVPPYLAMNAGLANLSSVATRLVQSQSIGFDGVQELLPASIVFANAASVHETSTAELTIALILASQRGIPDFVRAAHEGRWARAWYPSLADSTVLLVGYGGVGRAIESRLQGFETTVIRVARSERTDERGTIHALASLLQLLPFADVVVVGVPLDESTTGLVDDAFLSRMKDNSLFVNISRGPVADTDALVKHASARRLRLALDVTDPEPLPSDHQLFSLPNVLISPHVGGATPAMLPRMARLLSWQIERMRSGEEPLNVVLRT
jgi:phosphoglycerate dehydrogenase-like enzyme